MKAFSYNEILFIFIHIIVKPNVLVGERLPSGPQSTLIYRSAANKYNEYNGALRVALFPLSQNYHNKVCTGNKTEVVDLYVFIVFIITLKKKI